MTTGVPVGPNLVPGITTNAAGAYQVTLPVGVTPSSDLILQITTVAGGGSGGGVLVRKAGDGARI